MPQLLHYLRVEGRAAGAVEGAAGAAGAGAEGPPPGVHEAQAAERTEGGAGGGARSGGAEEGAEGQAVRRLMGDGALDWGTSYGRGVG